MKKKFCVVMLALLLTAVDLHAEGVPKIAGWKPMDRASTYTSEDLWNAINGAADLHLDYGFEELLIQKYHNGDRKIELEIFNQGNCINAFGIYRRELPPTAAVVDIGGEAAIRPPYTCMMFKGDNLVRVKMVSGEMNVPLCKELLGGVAKSLSGKDGLPAELAVLPRIGLKAGSEGYTAINYLGISDLPKVLHVKYRLKGKENIEVFKIVQNDSDALNASWKKIEANWNPFKKRFKKPSDAYYREIPYRGSVVALRDGAGIWGMVATGDPETLLGWLEEAVKKAPSKN